MTPTATKEQAEGMTDAAGPGSLGLHLSRPRWAGRALPLVLAIAAAGLFWLNQRYDSDASGGDTARRVVAAHVEELLSYDYRTIEDDLAAEGDWLTGAFASKYHKVVSDTIVPAARQARVVTKAAVSSSGVVSSDHHEVKLLLFVNVTTTSAALQEPKVSGSRLVVTVRYVDGAWRISDLDPV